MRHILVTALVAGCIAGLLFFAVQHAKLTPLILAAEVYESGAAEHQPNSLGGAEHASPAWEPSSGLERTAFTALADIIVGVGYALLLVGAIALRGSPVDVSRGMAWGAAGYAVFSLAPALGLPPELPGSHAADLLARQEWWLGTVAATACGSALLAFSRPVLLKVVGRCRRNSPRSSPLRRSRQAHCSGSSWAAFPAASTPGSADPKLRCVRPLSGRAAEMAS